MAEKKQETKATPLTGEELIVKEAELKTQSENLAKERADFEAEKEAHEVASKKLDEDIKEFEDFQEKVFKAQEDLATEREAFEAEKAEFEAGKSEAPKAEEVAEPVELEFEGENYQFTPDAPRTIRLNGSAVTQEEIAKDEDLKLQLIGGKSSLIIKKQ